MTTRCGDAEYTGNAADFLPARISLTAMREAAVACRGCDLWNCGRVVFGEGPASARVMFVGEQPGDQEELQGKPFVGPSGRLFDEALHAAGINRSEVYVTNAVKHFKYTPSERGKKRIHQKPNDREVHACYPWLDEEIATIHPLIIVAMGATAAQAMLGKQFRVTQQRGVAIESPLASMIIATVHPSSVLRSLPAERAEARQSFFNDIAVVAEYLQQLGDA